VAVQKVVERQKKKEIFRASSVTFPISTPNEKIKFSLEKLQSTLITFRHISSIFGEIHRCRLCHSQKYTMCYKFSIDFS